MSESTEVTVGKLQQKQEDMAKDIQEIKEDLRTLKDQVSELRIAFARYIGIGIGAIAVVEVIVKLIWN